jgi:thioesterase domain-containing protein
MTESWLEEDQVSNASPSHGPQLDPQLEGLAGAEEDMGDEVFVFPATKAQSRFWLLDQLIPGGNPALNMPLAVRLTGRLDLGALEKSFNALLARHETLRTTFHCEQGQLRQVIAPEASMRVPLVDVRDFPDAEQALVPEHLSEDEARIPFDLAHGPVFRAKLARLHPTEHLLLFTLHHIIADGWSKGLLLRELGQLYAAFATGKPSPLPELPLQFADYAQWQQDALAHGKLDGQLAYWRKQLDGDLPALDLPVDRRRRARRGSAPGAIRTRQLPPETAQALKALGLKEGVSQFMIFLAGFLVLLHRCTGGQEDIVVGSPSANRDRVEFENLAGLFVNPLLLRTSLAGEPTFRELLARVRRTALDAFSHADVPFETILEEVQPRHLQVNFLYQTAFPQPAQLPDLVMTPLGSSSGGALFEWTAAAIEEPGGTRLEIEYNVDLFDPETIDRVLDQYMVLLAGAAAKPEAAISALPLLDAAAAARALQSAPAIRASWRRLPTASVHWMERACIRPPRKADARNDAEDIAPRPGIGLLVLDAKLQPVPAGGAGLIYIRGLPAEDDAAIADPLGGGGTLVRTGDLGRVDPSGIIHWQGPIAEQRRVRGFRVDPDRVEAALREHPHVRQAVVLWAGPERRQLAAYFQSDGAPAALFAPSQMRAFLQERLAEEWIPESFNLVERFPLLPDGRLDAASFPPPSLAPAGKEERHDAPYLTVHYQLIDLWKQLLGVESIGIRDDFFALGGNSLLAMRMLYRIEQAFGRSILPATLFKEATIEHLADAMLQPAAGEPSAAVVRLNESGTKTPIFYLHGDFHGGGFYCIKLSRSLGADQPFYAMPHFEVTDPANVPATFEAAAKIYVERIRAVRPHGPYVIGGFCLGALFAFEVARQLTAQGEQVERLLMIDGTFENRKLKRLRKVVETHGRIRGLSLQKQLYYFTLWHFRMARLARWWQMGLGEQWAVVGRRLSSRWFRLRVFLKLEKPTAPNAKAVTLGAATPAALAPVHTDSAWFDPRWDVPLIFLWSAGGYYAKPYPGRTTLLLSTDMVPANERGLAAWKRYLPDLKVRTLSGSHLACITEYADSLAEAVAQSLTD